MASQKESRPPMRATRLGRRCCAPCRTEQPHSDVSADAGGGVDALDLRCGNEGEKRALLLTDATPNVEGNRPADEMRTEDQSMCRRVRLTAWLGSNGT